MKNKITITFAFTLLVVCGLLALYYLPPVNFNGSPLRKVDLLSDLRPDPVIEEVSDTDSIPLPVVAKPIFVDTCKAGMTCIEDYADSLELGMGAFYEALENRASLNRPVRIAYFGDSFIEGDILTADLRTLFQQKFGGRGVGYVPVTSRIAGFRPTVKHTFSGWESHAITDSVAFHRSMQDISNHYFIPRQGASVSLKGGKNYTSCLDTCDISSFYFFSSDSVKLSVQVNGGEDTEYIFPGDSTGMQVAQVEGRIGNVSWNVLQAGKNTRCFAATMDSKEGVILDNFSTRGSSGQQLTSIPLSILKAYNRLRTYDLIVLQYGLNVASENVSNYSYYTHEMEKVVRHLKEAFPYILVILSY